MKNGELIRVLVEDLDEEVLKRMPLWFRRLREAYARKKLCAFQ
jgi:hypothetical protein